MRITLERPTDAPEIRRLTEAAFKGAPHSEGTEAQIVDALRAAGALKISLIALEADAIVGHCVFSPVSINGETRGWYGLGPVSVAPEAQRRGIGQALIRDGLKRLELINAAGCVVLGDPGYYGRFGFESDPELVYGHAPPGYFQRLLFAGAPPEGEVHYHPAFGAA
jgi:predicted N-acetyltransferase YhbS